MATIFVSYDRDDKERVGHLVERLEKAGHVLWWDDKIRVGSAIDQEIASNISSADCVVIAWSVHSVHSDWVRAEAGFARAQTPLVPIRLDREVQIPLPFNRLHTADLSEWDLQSEHPEFKKLLEDLKHLPRKENKPPQAIASTAKKHRRRLRFGLTALIVLPTIIGTAAAVLAMRWRIPTKIEASLPICYAKISLSAASTHLLDAQTLQSVTVQPLARATFAPTELARPFPAPCWASAVTLGREMTLRGKDFILVAGNERGTDAVFMQEIGLNSPAEVTVGKVSGCHSSNQSEPGLRIELPKQTLFVSPADWLQLKASGAAFDRPTLPGCSSEPIELKARVAAGSPYLELRAAGERTTIALSPSSENQDITLFSAAGAAFASIELSHQQDSDGRPVSTLEGDGIVKFPGYDGKSVKIPQNERVFISDALARIAYEPRTNRLSLYVFGEAMEFRSTLTDYRLTQFDRLWFGHRPVALLAVCTWLVTVTAAALRLYKNLQRRGNYGG